MPHFDALVHLDWESRENQLQHYQHYLIRKEAAALLERVDAVNDMVARHEQHANDYLSSINILKSFHESLPQEMLMLFYDFYSSDYYDLARQYPDLVTLLCHLSEFQNSLPLPNDNASDILSEIGSRALASLLYCVKQACDLTLQHPESIYRRQVMTVDFSRQLSLLDDTVQAATNVIQNHGQLDLCQRLSDTLLAMQECLETQVGVFCRRLNEKPFLHNALSLFGFLLGLSLFFAGALVQRGSLDFSMSLSLVGIAVAAACVGLYSVKAFNADPERKLQRHLVYQFRDAASALLPLKACPSTLFFAKMPAFQIHIADDNNDENESLSILSPRRSMAY